ncbi:hypothetical protein OROHE_026848 [Orobanche hederae]
MPLQFDTKIVRFHGGRTSAKEHPTTSVGRPQKYVFEDYNAQSAGLQVGDVIFACDGIEIKNFLQLWELMFAKIGKEVELEVARVDLKVIKNFCLLIGEASIDEEIYGWRDMTTVDYLGAFCLFGIAG